MDLFDFIGFMLLTYVGTTLSGLLMWHILKRMYREEAKTIAEAVQAFHKKSEGTFANLLPVVCVFIGIPLTLGWIWFKANIGC